MNNISTNSLSYDESIEVNEDLDSPNELEGQPESGYNGVGPILHQNLPAQQFQGNNIVPFQNGGISNASASALGFGTFGGSSLIVGAARNNHNKHKIPLKRLGRTTRITIGMAAGIQYSKIDQLVFSQHIRRVF